jgi:hypothetical protein
VSISQTMCTSFKVECFQAVHDLSTDVIKMALYTSSATLGADTTAYTATGEATGTGYVAGGETLTSPVVTSSGTTAIVDFADAVWAASSITARGALIYNSSKSNKAIAVLDFGANKASSGDAFTVVMPAATATTALLRYV